MHGAHTSAQELIVAFINLRTCGKYKFIIVCKDIFILQENKSLDKNEKVDSEEEEIDKYET